MAKNICEGNQTGNGCGKDRVGVRLANELKKQKSKRGVISSLLELMAKRSVNIGKITN